MKKINHTLIALGITLASLSILSVQADTVDSTSGGGTECFHTNPIDTITCAMFHTVTTYNNPSPAGPVTITVTREVGDGGGLAAFGMLTCGGGGAGSCTSTDARSDVEGQTGGLGGPITAWGSIERGAGGSVTPTLAAGAHEIALHNYVSGAGNVQGCVWTGGSCNIMPENETTSGGTITIVEPVVVNLYFSVLLEKLLNTISSSFNIFSTAYADTLK